MHGDRLVLDPVAVVQPAELVGVERLQRPLPRTDLLVEDPEHGRRRMEAQRTADVRVAQARPKQERRRLDRTGRHDDRPRANAHRSGVDAGGGPVLDPHALCLRADHDPRTRGRRILEPRAQRRLLRAERAAVAAIAADDSLLAAEHVPRHRLDVPAERLQSAPHRLVPCRGQVVVRVHAEPLADSVEAGAELRRGKAQSLPLLEHVVGGAERGRVVDDRAAAEAGAGDQADALVVGRRSAAAAVEPPERGSLDAVEVPFRPVPALLEHDDVEARRGEHGRRDAAARSGADDADVALELELAARLNRLQPWRGRVLARSERAGIADLLPPAREHVREGERRLSQRLEARPHQRDGTVAPAAQHRLAPFARELRVAGKPGAQEEQQPLALPRRQVVLDRVEDGVGNALLDRAGREGLADRVERAHDRNLRPRRTSPRRW